MNKTHRQGLVIEKNAFQDDGNGIISFPNGQVITDGTKQRNGTLYDIASMDLSEYNGQLTADHIDSLDSVIGKVLGVAKTADAVTISGIQFAVKSNPYAQLAYDQVRGGFVTDLSIETYGPWPDDSDDTYYNAKLIGLSLVVVGNNKSARMKELVHNSIAKAKENGLDTTALEKIANAAEKPTDEPKPEAPAPEATPDTKVEPPKVETPEVQPEPEVTPSAEPAPEVTATVETPAPEVTPPSVEAPKQEQSNQESQDMKFVTIKNGRDFATPITYKNAAGEEVSVELAPGASVDVSEDQKETVDKQINSAEAPKPDLTEAIAEAVNAVKADFAAEIEKVREESKQAFDAAATEPEFKKDANSGKGPAIVHNKYDNMSKNDRMKLHLESLASAVMGNNLSAMKENEGLNQYNLDRLKAEGKVDNAINLSQLGNFVLGPEYLPGVVHNFSNFTPLLQRFQFEETLDIRTSWLEQIGDLTMTDTSMTDVGDNTNLKPISEYSTTSHFADLTEFAAVTPVDTSAIRFGATDIIGNLNKNYNNAYDKALATSVIGQLAKTLTSNGQYVPFDYSAGSVNALIALTAAYEQIAEFSPNGVILMTEQSRIQLLNFQLRAGANGPFANLFSQGIDGQPTFLDRPYVTVPSILMPKLNTAQTKSLVFEGQTVVNNYGLIIADPADFMGRVSGGLSYTVSSEAAYEVGGVTKSAFQRDQLVFRGYGYRKSAVLKTTGVSGISAPGIS